MKRLNLYYKKMNFPNSMASWKIHTPNMPLYLQCSSFAVIKFSRHNDVDDYDCLFAEELTNANINRIDPTHKKGNNQAFVGRLESSAVQTSMHVKSVYQDTGASIY